MIRDDLVRLFLVAGFLLSSEPALADGAPPWEMANGAGAAKPDFANGAYGQMPMGAMGDHLPGAEGSRPSSLSPVSETDGERSGIAGVSIGRAREASPDTRPSGSIGDHQSHSHEGRLHFSHPLIAESPSPDTKARLDHLFVDRSDSDEHTIRLELEYAFAPWISLEADTPYTFLDPDAGGSRSDLDNVMLAVKLASFAFRRHGLLLGGGIEFELPTGNDSEGIGSDNELEVAPFLDIGLQYHDLQAIAFVEFGIPTNQDEEEEDEVDLELGFNAAFLYRLSPQVTPLLEFDGEAVAAGDEDEIVVNVTPGVKVRPFAESSLTLGFGVSIPLTDDQEFDVRTVLSAFYHF